MNYITENDRIYALSEENEVIAEITWHRFGDAACIDHTFVDDSLRGQGVAGKLVELAVEQIEGQGLKVTATCSYAAKKLGINHKPELFPDGTLVDDWFYNTEIPALESLGRQYRITDYGVKNDGQVYTRQLQEIIDKAAQTGGVIVVPDGTYITGAIKFPKGVNLYIEEGGVLKGSDDIADYILEETRIEGQTCMYYSALINVDGADGFTLMGPGTIDGNGLRSWKAFWLRRKWNPACTNKDEQRPRLVYISNSRNVTICKINLRNSHFWTTHLYRCDHVRYLGCNITSPMSPVPAPSTDAIDIDVCTDVLVKGCHIEVNDDGVVLKGGKGPWADTAPENGSNERIIVEDCNFGFSHACFTCGSESIHDRNMIIRRCTIDGTMNFLRFKMRPDTPQHYEYLLAEDIKGRTGYFLDIYPWTQFYDLGGRTDLPISKVDHVRFNRCDIECKVLKHVKEESSQYILSDFEWTEVTETAIDDIVTTEEEILKRASKL